MGAAVASKSADTAAGAQRSPSSRRRAVQDNRLRGPGQRGAPPYEGDLRLQRSIGREPTEGHFSGPQRRTATRSIWVLSPPRRHPGASRLGAQPVGSALQTPSTRCSASVTSATVRLAHLCRSDRGHRISGSGACCGRAPTPLPAFISADHALRAVRRSSRSVIFLGEAAGTTGFRGSPPGS